MLLIPDFRFLIPDPAQMVSRRQDFPDVRSPQPPEPARAGWGTGRMPDGRAQARRRAGIRWEKTLSLDLQQKQKVVAEVAKEVALAQAIVMVENRGMKVADMTQLRAKARASGIYFRVVKNTLVRRAVEKTPFAALADRMVGPLAYGIGRDPVAVAKVLNDFAKGNEKFVITGGAMPGQVMSARQIAALAALPSRDELIGKLLGTMQAPVAKFVRTLNEIPTRLVRVLAAVRDAKQAA
jgi:large subunit ribosomal protein L10